MELVEKLMKEWETFKVENDRRLKEVEKTGRADPLTAEKIDKHSAAIGELQAQLNEVQKKGQRVSAQGEANEARAEYAKAFGSYLRRGAVSELLAKALSTGSNADGGYVVAPDLDKQMAEVELIASPMRQVATVIQVGNEKYQKNINIHGLAGGWVGETAARPATASPQWAQFSPVFGELYAHTIASQRVLDDGMFDLEGHIATEAGKTFGLLENTEFTSGAGSSGVSPKGFLAYTPSATPTFGTNIGLVKSGTAGSIIADKLFDVPASLIAGYRAGSIWMMQAMTLAAVRKLKDSQNRYLWEPGLNAGVSGSLLGYPVVENEDMPAVAALANAIAFGNFKRGYLIADVVGTRILRDPLTNKPNVVFYATKRVGAGVIDTKALVAYQLAV